MPAWLRGYYVYASAAGQAVTLVFTGAWLGLVTWRPGQRSDSVTLDGASRGVVDAYARTNMRRVCTHNNLASGTHTLTLQLLSTKRPPSGGTNFRLDYFDVWDGTSLANGTRDAVRHNVELDTGYQLWRSEQRRLLS